MTDLFDWRLGLTFGAIVAATDPVAVTALFRDLGAPPRLATLIEGESLVNDGIGVVLFSLVVSYVLGSQTGPVAASGEFIVVAVGGFAVGVFVGGVVAMIIQRVNDPMIEIALTMIAAYGSFVLAEGVGASGVLATVAAGVICGRHGRDEGMSARSRAATESFWLYVAFALNSIVFLLIGFDFDAGRLLRLWPEALVAFVAMLIARAAIVATLMLIQRRSREVMPRSWGYVIVWGGLRGALSMVLALALPSDFPQRELIIALTTGVVVTSLLLQGTSMPLLLRRAGITRESAHGPVTRA
jgi:CPA1 family monovalent cation:H+ antiporter